MCSLCFTVYVLLYSVLICNCIHNNENEKEFDYGQNSEVHQVIPYALDTERLFELALFENDLYKKFKAKYENVTDMETLKGLENLRLYLEDYQYSTMNATKHLPKNSAAEIAFVVSTNPILMYKMIARLANDLDVAFKDLEKHPELGPKIEMKLHDQVISRPTDRDVDEAIDGLLRIQYVYDFPVDKLARGEISNFKTQAGLNGKDCLYIGKYALEKQKYAMAIDWLELGGQLTFPGNDNGYATKASLAKYLSIAEIRHDREWEDWSHNQMLKDLQAVKDIMANNIPNSWKLRGEYTERREDLFDRKVSKNDHKSETNTTRTKVANLFRETSAGLRTEASAEFESYLVCAGQNFQTAREKSLLRCWLDTKTHPYWRINPLKMELLHGDPELIQIHDFIGNKMVNDIEALAFPTLKRSAIINYDIFGAEFSNYRTSLNTWIYDTPQLDPLYSKIEFATGLQVKLDGSSQALQVVDYSSLGSHYHIHHDSMLDPQLTKKDGDRIATFMIYLNTVELGGHTAFPMTGTASKPIKGSAVLWYNFFRNGTEDRRVQHSGCPVVLGRKLIANKWILAYENMFNRTCTLNKLD